VQQRCSSNCGTELGRFFLDIVAYEPSWTLKASKPRAVL
jgi:hypothetical protein